MCGKPIAVEYTFSCLYGSFPSIKYIELRDITATLLSEVCSNVHTELPLQPLSREQCHFRSANVEDGAQLDVSARDRKIAFFDVKALTLWLLCMLPPFAQCYCRAELEKKRECLTERVSEVEREIFSVFLLWWVWSGCNCCVQKTSNIGL